MMYATEKQFLSDFVTRTKYNYSRLENGPYEVTQLINSVIGLLLVPRDHVFKMKDEMIDSELLDQMMKAININTYVKGNCLFEIVRHMRNGFAHSRVEYISEQKPMLSEGSEIVAVIIRDHEVGTQSHDFEMELSVELLRNFLFAFSDAAIACVEGQNES